MKRATSPDLQTWMPTHAVLFETESDYSIGTAYKSQTDYYTYTVHEDLIEVMVESCWRLQPGQSAQVGEQGIWMFKGSHDCFREQLQSWYKSIDYTIKVEYPNWLREAVLYETCAGGHVDSRFSDVGGFANLSKQVDYLADLGVDLVWYNSVHEHKTPPNAAEGGWNHYSVLDHSRIDSILGGEQQFRNLIDKTLKHGIHPLGEVVLWGGSSKQGKELKDWHIHDRDNNILNPWGAGCVLDYSSPPWQKVIQDSVRLVADCGIQGVRIDVADGHGSNWSSPLTNHASFSTLGGSLEMLEAIRDGCRNQTREPILIPESLYDRPEYLHRGITLGYGMQTTFFFANNIHASEEPELLCQQLNQFFENERGSLPEGSLVIRTLNNHDTVVDKGRLPHRYGTGLARALYGVCLCVPGIPMMYQEDENGSYDFLKQVHSARKRIRPFCYGDVDYNSIHFSPKVFSVVREHRNQIGIGLINLSGNEVSGEVTLAAGHKGSASGVAIDRVSGISSPMLGSRFAWKMNPYQVSLIEVVGANSEIEKHTPGTRSFIPATTVNNISIQSDGSRMILSLGDLSAQITAGSSEWTLEKKSDEISILSSNSGKVELTQKGQSVYLDALFNSVASDNRIDIQISNSTKWGISGQTAWLEDFTLQRHFPFADDTHYYWNRNMIWGRDPWGMLYNQVLPNDRLWQSVLDPLHSKQPGFIFTDNTSSLAISDVDSNAENILLKVANNKNEPNKPDLVLSFLNQDSDLSPKNRAFGLGEQWTMEHYPQPDLKPLQVKMILTPATEPVLKTMVAAGCGSLIDKRPSISRSRSQFGVDSFNAAWLIEPGTVTWSHLCSVLGRYRLAVELRHSEVSPEGKDLDNAYSITVNGVQYPIEWIQRNTCSTGNAFFGTATTPPFNLQASSNTTVSIQTLKPWCAVRGPLRLVPAE